VCRALLTANQNRRTLVRRSKRVVSTLTIIITMGLFKKIFSREQKESLDKGLEKTKEGFLKKIGRVMAGKSEVDEEVLDELEEALISADVGVDTTIQIIDRIEKRVARDKYLNAGELNRILKEEIAGMLTANDKDSRGGFDLPEDKKPYVILVVGVNGVGKTTTIGKLAHHYKNAGKSVLLGAADTFRAAAVDQLTIWSERVGVPIVKQAMGSDPGAVAFDTVQSGAAKNTDVILIDTAGRLHNKRYLMEELGKIRRVVKKVIPDAPHEVLLVLDGSTGQNALEQARQFTAATDVTALAITKLDGTAKGGVVLAIANQFKIPVKYIGIGEKMEDLQEFDRQAFVDALFTLDK
jgi:fused signal recognition particle receptor